VSYNGLKIGMAFSGGGIRCVAHLAVYQALEEEGIVPDSLSGTSGGALAACLLAHGLKPQEILAIVTKTRVLQAIRPALTISGLLNVEKALAFSLSYLPETFEELKKPVTISATNVRTGKAEQFSSGPLLPAILASCCMPVIFKPVQIGQDFYMDGGLTNNLPVEPLKESCDKVIGVHTNPVNENYNVMNMKGLLERTFLLAINGNVEQRKDLCDIFLEPPSLINVKVFQFNLAGAIFEETYAWLREQIPAVKAKLS
jgi:NTE family protein